MVRVQFIAILLFVPFLTGYGTAKDGPLPYQVRHQAPALLEQNTPFNLTFKVPSVTPDDIQEATLFYRPDGQLGYHQKKVRMQPPNFTIEHTVEDKQTTSLEYYFQIQLKNGQTITYPQNEASAEPIRVEVIESRSSKSDRRVQQTGVDYTILSPEPGTTVRRNDVVIALTLFYDPVKVDTANTSFKLLVDGRDITEQANASAYFYTYSSDELAAGDHRAQLLLQKKDTSLVVTSWDFSILDPDDSRSTFSSSQHNTQKRSWAPTGEVQLSARNQEVGGFRNDALSGNVRLSGEKGSVSYSAYGLLTTQEDPRLQPQNRFGASLYIGEWLDIEAGHLYPTLSSLTIAGQRMQGINAGLHLWDRAVNLRFVHGKLRRGINNLYQPIEPEYHSYEGSMVDTSYVLTVNDGGNGTFERDVTGGRLGFGRGQNFDFGLNVLKVEDDTSSINYINSFDRLMNRNPRLAGNLSSHEQGDLAQNSGQLNISGNPAPKGNFVAASDLDIRFDKNRIRLQTDAAVSLLNQDISGGIISQEQADELGLVMDDNTASLLEQLSWLIIINENMNNLPFRFNTESSQATSSVYFPKGILATKSELGFNYLNNNLRLRYRWIGPHYNSLANTTIRKDIAGFSVSDRLQLFENRLYLTLGYERLHDNVNNTRDATTNTITYRGNVGWYPIDPDLPRLSLSFLNRDRDNDVALFNPYLSSSLQGTAIQNFIIQQGDTLLAPNPRQAQTYQLTTTLSQGFSLLGAQQDISLSYSMLTTEDQKFRYGDSRSTSLSANVINRFSSLPVQTNLGFNINNTETSSGLTGIRIVGFNIGGTVFLMDEKLRLNSSITFTKNRSESIPLVVNNNIRGFESPQEDEPNDDYYQPDEQSLPVSVNKAYIISSGANYRISNRHSFLVRFRYSNIRNTITGNGIPNDHLLQAQYTFNF